MYQYHTPVLDYNGGPPATTRALTTQSVMEGTYPEEYREEPFVDPRSRALAVYVDREKEGPLRFTGRQPWKEYGLQRVFAESRYNLNYQLQPTWICCGREKGEPGCWKSNTRGEIQAYNVLPEIRQLRGAVPDKDRFVELWNVTKKGTPWVDYKYYERLHNQMQEIKADRSLALYVRAYLIDFELRLDAEKDKLSNLARLYSLELEYNEVHGRYRPLTLRGPEKWLSFIQADLRPVRESIHKKQLPAPAPTPAPVPKELEPATGGDTSPEMDPYESVSPGAKTSKFPNKLRNRDDTMKRPNAGFLKRQPVDPKKFEDKSYPEPTPMSPSTESRTSKELETTWTFAQNNSEQLLLSIENETPYVDLDDFNNVLRIKRKGSDKKNSIDQLWEWSGKFDSKESALLRYSILQYHYFEKFGSNATATWIGNIKNRADIIDTYYFVRARYYASLFPKGTTQTSFIAKIKRSDNSGKEKFEEAKKILDEFLEKKRLTNADTLITEDDLQQLFSQFARKAIQPKYDSSSLNDAINSELNKITTVGEFGNLKKEFDAISDLEVERLYEFTLNKKNQPKLPTTEKGLKSTFQLQWCKESCWFDATMNCLFGFTNTSLVNDLWNMKKLKIMSKVVQYTFAGAIYESDKPVSKCDPNAVYQAILQDVLQIQMGETLKSAQTPDVWNNCIETLRDDKDYASVGDFIESLTKSVSLKSLQIANIPDDEFTNSYVFANFGTAEYPVNWKRTYTRIGLIVGYLGGGGHFSVFLRHPKQGKTLYVDVSSIKDESGRTKLIKETYDDWLDDPNKMRNDAFGTFEGAGALYIRNDMIDQELGVEEQPIPPNPLQMRASTFDEVEVELTNLIKTNGTLKKQLYDLWQPIIADKKNQQKMMDLDLWNKIQGLKDVSILQRQYLEVKIIQYYMTFTTTLKNKWKSIEKSLADVNIQTSDWYIKHFVLNDMEIKLKERVLLDNAELETKKQTLLYKTVKGVTSINQTKENRVGEIWKKIEKSGAPDIRQHYLKWRILTFLNLGTTNWDDLLLSLNDSIREVNNDDWEEKHFFPNKTRQLKEHISTLEEIEFHPDYRLSEDEYHWDKIYSEIIEPMSHVASQYSEQTENIDAFRRLGVYPLVRVDQEQDSMPLVFQTKYLHTLSVLGHMLHQMEQQQPIDEELIVRADAEWPDRL